MCLRIRDRKKKVYLKREDRKRILLSKVGTGKELWSENWDRKRIVISEMGTGKLFPVPILRYTVLFRSLLLRIKFFSGPQFWNHFSFPVPSFEIQFSFPKKFKFLFNFKALKEKPSIVISGQASLTYKKIVFCDRLVPLF